MEVILCWYCYIFAWFLFCFLFCYRHNNNTFYTLSLLDFLCFGLYIINYVINFYFYVILKLMEDIFSSFIRNICSKGSCSIHRPCHTDLYHHLSICWIYMVSEQKLDKRSNKKIRTSTSQNFSWGILLCCKRLWGSSLCWNLWVWANLRSFRTFKTFHLCCKSDVKYDQLNNV